MDELIAQYCDVKEQIEPLKLILKDLHDLIKDRVLEEGPVETERAKVSIRQGYIRSSWDNKRLRGYAVANPDVLRFLTETETRPTISIKVL